MLDHNVPRGIDFLNYIGRMNRKLNIQQSREHAANFSSSFFLFLRVVEELELLKFYHGPFKPVT